MKVLHCFEKHQCNRDEPVLFQETCEDIVSGPSTSEYTENSTGEALYMLAIQS